MTLRSLLRAAVSLALVAAALVVLETPAVAAPRGPFIYEPFHSNDMCLDNPNGNPDDNVLMTIYRCNDGDNQLWYEVDKGSGYVEIKNKKSNKCLTVRNASKNKNEAVLQFSCNGGLNAQWKPVMAFDGSVDWYYLKNRNSGWCLHVKNAGTTNGSTLVQHDCKDNGKGNNEWTWYYPQ